MDGDGFPTRAPERGAGPRDATPATVAIPEAPIVPGVRDPSSLRALQRSAGNRAVSAMVGGRPRLQRQGPPVAAPPPAAAVTRPTLSELRTIAQGYAGDYFSAARAGLNDFERDVATGFDWSAFWLNVGGNVIWATASFATGGTAFIVSIAGIALSTAASASTVHSAPDFHREAANNINAVVSTINNRVDAVTRDVDAAAAAGNWDDGRTRSELLRRLVQPGYVSVASGGIPNLSQPRVAASIREQLLIRASQVQSTGGLVGNLVYGPGYYEQVWEIDGAIEYVQYPFSPAMPVLKPQTEWSYGIRSARLAHVSPDVPDINAKLNDVYTTRGTRIDGTQWPIEKRLVLTGAPPFGVTYVLDDNNALARWEAVAFARFLGAQGHEPDSYLRRLLAMIQGFSGAAIPRVDRLTP